MTSPSSPGNRWTFHRVIWLWYALPLVMTVLLAYRLLFHYWDAVPCPACNGRQALVMGEYAVLPLLAMLASYGIVGILYLLKIRHRLIVGHLAGAPLAIAVAVFCVQRIDQFWP